MKSDPVLLLVASLGAGLLAAGGAFLRAAFLETRKVPAGDTNGLGTDAGTPAIGGTSSELASLREELVLSNSVKEAQRIEMVEQRQRAERQVQGAQAEIQRLSAEVEAEKARTKASDDETKELKKKLSSLEEEARRARAAAAVPRDAGRNETDIKALTAAQGEVAELQRKLKTANDDKEAARAKAEALERLVEGVRARSRELAEELKGLKGTA